MIAMIRTLCPPATLLVVLAALGLAGCDRDGSDGAASPPAVSQSPTTASSSPSATASAPTTSAPATTSPAPTSTAPAPTSPAPACQVPSWLRGKDLERIPTSDKVVALTFDAGANADGVPSILATLSAQDVPGTFFLTGNFVEDFPAESRKIADRYVVGNHSMTHPDFSTLSDDEIRAELSRSERAIRTTTGQDPRRFFRFPFGARDTHTIRLVNSRCYAAFRWTVDTLGWKGTSGGMTAGKVAARVLDAATPGEIVLMHVGSNPDDHSTLDADALPQIIDGLRDRGYSFVSLSRLLDPAP